MAIRVKMFLDNQPLTDENLQRVFIKNVCVDRIVNDVVRRNSRNEII